MGKSKKKGNRARSVTKRKMDQRSPQAADDTKKEKMGIKSFFGAKEEKQSTEGTLIVPWNEAVSAKAGQNKHKVKENKTDKKSDDHKVGQKKDGITLQDAKSTETGNRELVEHSEEKESKDDLKDPNSVYDSPQVKGT